MEGEDCILTWFDFHVEAKVWDRDPVGSREVCERPCISEVECNGHAAVRRLRCI
jgi:hypothetical protein